jgi:hypothetical protein
MYVKATDKLIHPNNDMQALYNKSGNCFYGRAHSHEMKSSAYERKTTIFGFVFSQKKEKKRKRKTDRHDPMRNRGRKGALPVICSLY